jgi:hypothetical protein
LPDGTGGPQLLAVLLAPIVIFALLSGRLSEFRAPGGWQARFTVAASAKVSDGGMRIPTMPSGHTELKASTDSDLMPSIVLT